MPIEITLPALPDFDPDLQGKELAPGEYESGYTHAQLRAYGEQCARAGWQAALEATLPPEVIAWRDAYSEYIAAITAYNVRVKAIRELEKQFPDKFGRYSPQAEYEAWHRADERQRRLIEPMHAALVRSLPLPEVKP